MAVAIEQSVTNKNETASVVLPSWTVNAGELILVMVTLRDETRVPTVSGHGLTFTQIINLDNAQGQNGLNVFRAQRTGSSDTGSITVSIPGNSLPAVCFASRFSGVPVGNNGADAIDATATNAGPPVTDDNDMLQSITTVADNCVIVAVGTHRLATFMVPSGETGLIINEIQGSGGDLTTSSWWRKTGTQSPAGAFEMGALNDLNSDRDWCMAVVSVKPSGGTTFSQSVAGTLTSAGALTKSAGKSLAATAASSGALAKSAGKSLAAVLASTAAMAKNVGKSLAATAASVGALTKSAGKSLAGSLDQSGAETKQAGKGLAALFDSAGNVVRDSSSALAGTLGFTGDATKRPATALAGTLGLSGALDAIKVLMMLVEGSLSTSGAIVKHVGKGLAALLDSAGAAAREIASSLAGTLDSSGDAAKKASSSLAGALGLSGAISIVRPVVLAGALALSGGLAKLSAVGLAGTLATSGAVLKAVGKFLTSVLGLAGSLLPGRIHLKLRMTKHVYDIRLTMMVEEDD